MTSRLSTRLDTIKRFSLGWFEEDYIRNGPVMAVHTPEGPISALANIYPEYQRNEATIDLMRHRRDAERGTMDYLFVSLFLWARSEGYETFNLGLSSLSGIGEEPGDLAVERAMHYITGTSTSFIISKVYTSLRRSIAPIGRRVI